MRNQPQYSHGDIIGVVVDVGSGDIEFFKNGESVINWRAALRGPVSPYVSMKHGGPGATILQYWRELKASSKETRLLEPDKEVVGDVPALPQVDGSILEVKCTK